MNFEEAKEELKQYQNNKKFIENKIELMENLKDQATKITSVLSDMPKTQTEVSDKVAENVSKIIDIQNNISQDYIKQQDILLKIERKLQSLKQPYGLILQEIYIKGCSIEKVSAELKYSYIHVCRLHGEALKEYAKR